MNIYLTMIDNSFRNLFLKFVQNVTYFVFLNQTRTKFALGQLDELQFYQTTARPWGNFFESILTN